MLFLKISSADVSFNKKTLTYKSFITSKALLTTKQVQIVNPKKFVLMALNTKIKTFMLHVAIREREKMLVHSEMQTQIQDKVSFGALIFDETPTAILVEYSNYSNIFSLKDTAELPDRIEINDHAIKLEKSKELAFGLIYSLRLIRLM